MYYACLASLFFKKIRKKFFKIYLFRVLVGSFGLMPKIYSDFILVVMQVLNAKNVSLQENKESWSAAVDIVSILINRRIVGMTMFVACKETGKGDGRTRRTQVGIRDRGAFCDTCVGSS